MKHVLTSAGLLAMGAAALHAYDPLMTRQQTGRPFTVAATVRGFYDDNVTTLPDSHPEKVETFGAEVSPSVHLNLPLEQTFIRLGYTYSLRWYEDRPDRDIDQGHEFNAKLRHQFSPRNDIGLDNTFILTSEPTLATRDFVGTPVQVRTEESILHNRFAAEHNVGLTPLFYLGFGYVNNWYDYEQDGPGSRSALLDRLEHLFRIDARYQLNPQLVGLIGYNFGLNNYTGDEELVAGTGIESEFRDSYSHYGYIGADYDVTAKLRTSIRLGAQYTDYHEADETAANPYVDASLVYSYLPGSYVQLGVRHTRSATDVVAYDVADNPEDPARDEGRPTLDAQSSLAYMELRHEITPDFHASVNLQYQHSTFEGGIYDGESEDLLLAGFVLDYRINRHLSVEAGYNFDLLESDVDFGGGDDRGYDRNRVYIGLRAQY
jgi:predicted porin